MVFIKNRAMRPLPSIYLCRAPGTAASRLVATHWQLAPFQRDHPHHQQRDHDDGHHAAFLLLLILQLSRDKSLGRYAGLFRTFDFLATGPGRLGSKSSTSERLRRVLPPIRSTVKRPFFTKVDIA